MLVYLNVVSSASFTIPCLTSRERVPLSPVTMLHAGCMGHGGGNSHIVSDSDGESSSFLCVFHCSVQGLGEGTLTDFN